MSNDLSDANAFLQAQGAKSFPFNAVGDRVSGTIVSAQVRQQTNLETGVPETWRDGSPKNMLVVTLQTELQEDDNDDGVRSLFLRGGNYTAADGKGTSSLTAVRDAIKASGSKELAVGAKLTVAYTGNGVKSNNAFTAPKLYSARYEPPVARVDVEELF